MQSCLVAFLTFASKILWPLLSNQQTMLAISNCWHKAWSNPVSHSYDIAQQLDLMMQSSKPCIFVSMTHIGWCNQYRACCNPMSHRAKHDAIQWVMGVETLLMILTKRRRRARNIENLKGPPLREGPNSVYSKVPVSLQKQTGFPNVIICKTDCRLS